MKKVLSVIIGAALTTIAVADIKKVDVKQVTVPVMIHRPYNQVLGLNVVNNQKPTKVKSFIVSLKGSRYSTIKTVSVHKSLMTKEGTPQLGGGPGDVVATAAGNAVNKKSGIIVLRGDYKLAKGDNHFWVSVEVTEKASLSGRVCVDVKAIKTDTKTFTVKGEKATQRIGFAVTTPNQEISVVKPVTGKLIEKRISKYFRIPGLARTRKGTLIATFDNRYAHNGDLPADIDVAVRRSTDGGQTWSPNITSIAARDVEGLGHGCGDPAILVDYKTDRIWIAGLGAPKTGHPIWKSETGSASPDNCGQFILAYSDDDGKTWSKPINITKDIKRLDDADTKKWGLVFQGPGNGICMKNGTLVFPAQIWGHLGKGSHWGVLVYSKDRGKTWTSSKAMEFGGSETQVAELSDGSLMLNCREGAGRTRAVGVTKDMGETWTKFNGDPLRQPVCQAGLTMVNKVMGHDHVLVFSNPDSGHGRKHMTLKSSTNDGKNWTEGLLYDERGGMGYSAVIRADKNNIGVLYEGEHHYIYYLRVPFKDFVKKK